MDSRVGKHVNVRARALQPVGAFPRAERMRESVARSTSAAEKRRRNAADFSDQEHLAILIDKKAPLEKKLEAFSRARELREAGTLVTILPMRKNMKQQIALLEAEGYHNFEKIYKD